MCAEAGGIGGEGDIIVRNGTEAWGYTGKREEVIQQPSLDLASEEGLGCGEHSRA